MKTVDCFCRKQTVPHITPPWFARCLGVSRPSVWRQHGPRQYKPKGVRTPRLAGETETATRSVAAKWRRGGHTALTGFRAAVQTTSRAKMTLGVGRSASLPNQGIRIHSRQPLGTTKSFQRCRYVLAPSLRNGTGAARHHKSSCGARKTAVPARSKRHVCPREYSVIDCSRNQAKGCYFGRHGRQWKEGRRSELNSNSISARPLLVATWQVGRSSRARFDLLLPG